LQICGRCEQRLTTGANNTKTVKFKSGAFYYAGGTGLDALSVDDVGEVVYVLDDQTIGKAGLTAGATAAGIPVNTPAGRLYDYDQYGPCVFIEWPAPPLAPIGPTGV
jgi:hypothetical protein